MVWLKQDSGIRKIRLRCWVRVAESIVSLMSYWVISDTRVQEVRTTTLKVTEIYNSIDEHICKFKDYDDKISTRFKEPRLFPNGNPTNQDEF